MKRAVDTFRFTTTVNEPNHEYDVSIPADFSLSEMLDRLDTVIANTEQATSYVVVVTRKTVQVEENEEAV